MGDKLAVDVELSSVDIFYSSMDLIVVSRENSCENSCETSTVDSVNSSESKVFRGFVTDGEVADVAERADPSTRMVWLAFPQD